MNLFVYLIPALFVVVFIVAAIRKVKVYDSFAEGVKGAIPLVVSLFPFVAAVLILSQLFEASGLSDGLQSLLAPVFRLVGVPEEIGKLALVKPFSGSGATALLSEIFQKYGADSYIARCACVAYGSSETVFYVAAVYFASVREKNSPSPSPSPFAPTSSRSCSAVSYAVFFSRQKMLICINISVSYHF